GDWFNKIGILLFALAASNLGSSKKAGSRIAIQWRPTASATDSVRGCERVKEKVLLRTSQAGTFNGEPTDRAHGSSTSCP
ncbi:MAG: hypothetical protein EB003_13920, partial [Flavobacteriia bacterium]|nr:hypothetical protein [Flavobacteriia bacterium]